MKLNLIFIGFLLAFASVSALSVCNSTTYWDTHPDFTKVSLLGNDYYVLTNKTSNLTHPSCMASGSLLSEQVSYDSTNKNYRGTTLYGTQISAAVHNVKYNFTKNETLWPSSNGNRTVFSTDHVGLTVAINYSNGTYQYNISKAGASSNYVHLVAHKNATGDYLCSCVINAASCTSGYTANSCVLIPDGGTYEVWWYIYGSAGTSYSHSVLNEFMNSTQAPRNSCSFSGGTCDISQPLISFGNVANSGATVAQVVNYGMGGMALYNLGNNNTAFSIPSGTFGHGIKDQVNSVVVLPSTNQAGAAVFYYTEALAGFSNPYEAYVITTGGTLIKPEYSLYLPSTIIYKRYSTSDLATNLYGNRATVIQDEFGVCYLVPPYTPANYSLTYTLTAYQIDCGSSVESTREIPILPTYSSCYSNGTHYIMNTTYSETSLFERYLTYVNSTVEYAQSSDTSFYEAVEITNETAEIDLQVNGYTRCYWSNETKILGLDDVPQSDLTNTIIIAPLMIITTALSVYNPFVFIFTLALNDMFELVDITGLLLMAAAVGLFSFVSAWEGEKTLKALITLFLITGVYVVQMAVYAPTTFGSESSDLTSRITDLADTFNAITSSSDIISIITLVVPLFLINLIILLLELPALMVSLIFTSLTTLLPTMAAPLAAFEIALTVGAYAWLILKAYELGRNMFRGV